MCGGDCKCGGSRQGTCARAASTSDADAPEVRTLDSKLGAFDVRAETAFDWFMAFLEAHRDEVLTLARARHITGHFVYGDTRMFEYDRGRLAKEILEEAADGVCYSVARLAL